MKTLHTCDVNTDSICIRVIWENFISLFHYSSQWRCCCDSSQKLLNLLTVSLSLFFSETPSPPSHGRLHPDVLSRTHTDSGGRWTHWGIFYQFFCSSALGQNLPNCSPLFLFIQEVAHTGANHSTALSLNDPAYFYRKEQLMFSLCFVFKLHCIHWFLTSLTSPFLLFSGKKWLVVVWLKLCYGMFYTCTTSVYDNPCGFLVNEHF